LKFVVIACLLIEIGTPVYQIDSLTTANYLHKKLAPPSPKWSKELKDNRFETRHDYETELIERAEQERHLKLECDGPPRCDWCVLAIEMGDE